MLIVAVGGMVLDVIRKNDGIYSECHIVWFCIGVVTHELQKN